MANVISWNEGGPRPPVPAKVVMRELTRLSRRLNRNITPEDFVEAARPPDSILHPCLPWGDAEELAEQLRLVIAGSIIRQLRISFIVEEQRTVVLRAMTSVRSGGARGYLATTKVLGEPELLQQMIDRAIAELESYLRRYATLLVAIGAAAAGDQLLTVLQSEIAASRP
jgi:hypothetical protein